MATVEYVDKAVDELREDYVSAVFNVRMDLQNEIDILAEEQPNRFDFKATEAFGFVKKHWKTIGMVATAFGVPVGMADPGAFVSVLGALKNMWPF